VNPPIDPAQTTLSSATLAALDPPIPLIILEPDFAIRWISSAAVLALELRPEIFLGRSWYDIFPQSLSQRALHEGLCSGAIDAVDLPRAALGVGERTRLYSLCMRRLNAADGKLESLLVIGVDVASQGEAAWMHGINVEGLTAAMCGANTAYWSTDLQSDQTEISDHFFSMTGIDRARWEADTEPWCSWVHPDDAPMGCVRYRAHIAGSTDRFEHEYRLRTPHGWRWLLDRGTIVQRDSSGVPLRMTGTTTDISERKALEICIFQSMNQDQLRLSHDLHEGLAQRLTGAALSLATVSKQVQPHQTEAAQDLRAITNELRQAIDVTLSLARGMLPASIERGDIAPALLSLADEASSPGQLDVRCEINGWDQRILFPDTAQHVYAIARLVLQDARAHKGSKSIVIALNVDADDHLVLTMAQQCSEGVSAGPGNDLLSSRILAYRAQALGGALSEEQLPSGVKQVRLRCPLRLHRPEHVFEPKRGFCDCIPLHERNIHLTRGRSDSAEIEIPPTEPTG
jgi:signal transduction histidine kinase